MNALGAIPGRFFCAFLKLGSNSVVARFLAVESGYFWRMPEDMEKPGNLLFFNGSRVLLRVWVRRFELPAS